MNRRTFVLACGLAVLSATSIFAQASTAAPQNKPKPDQITGTWTGTLSPKNAPGPVSVTLTLKFDGKSGVTGTIEGLPNPGDVKSGSFDPKTSALKLQLGKTGESAVLLTLEGTVVKGTVTGTVIGEGDGDFSLTKKN